MKANRFYDMTFGFYLFGFDYTDDSFYSVTFNRTTGRNPILNDPPWCAQSAQDKNTVS